MNRQQTYLPGTLEAEKARELVDLFFEGSSSPAQEKALYAYYGSSAPGSLPADLEAYREMFGWYAGMGPRSAGATRNRRPAWRHVWASAAAVVALVALGGAWIWFGSSKRSDMNSVYASYDGSYIVREGVRTTDIRLIYATVAAAEQYADSVNRVADTELGYDADYDRIAVEEALSAISDPALAARIRSDIFD